MGFSPYNQARFRKVALSGVVMKKRIMLLVLAATLLSGCTSIFGGGGGVSRIGMGIGGSSDDAPPAPTSSSAKLAYVGNLANNRVARVDETIAYTKDKSGVHTTVYKYKGVDGGGGIHIMRIVRNLYANGRRAVQENPKKHQSGAVELVFLPEQTLMVSPGIHVVFVRTTPSELHYRVIMTGN